MSVPFDRERVRAICFDIDGTLADTDDAYVLRVAGWLRPLALLLPQCDVNLAARRLVLRVETPVNSALALLDRLHMDQLLGPLLDHLHRLRGIAANNSIDLIVGAREMLDRLSRRYPLGVVTAREQTSAHSILSNHSLEGYFHCIATARTTLRAKPHPAPVLWAASMLDVPPAHLLMVGDTAADMLSGRAAGAQTAAFLCGFGEFDELEAAGANVILRGPQQLTDLLLGQH